MKIQLECLNRVDRSLDHESYVYGLNNIFERQPYYQTKMIKVADLMTYARERFQLHRGPTTHVFSHEFGPVIYHLENCEENYFHALRFVRCKTETFHYELVQAVLIRALTRVSLKPTI
jgi:hypothetical protein